MHLTYSAKTVFDMKMDCGLCLRRVAFTVRQLQVLSHCLYLRYLFCGAFFLVNQLKTMQGRNFEFYDRSGKSKAKVI